MLLRTLPLAVVVAYVAVRHVPESSDAEGAREIDVAGAIFAMLGLGGATYALIEAPVMGYGSPTILVTGIGGLLSVVGVFFVGGPSSHPLRPRSRFNSPALPRAT